MVLSYTTASEGSIVSSDGGLCNSGSAVMGEKGAAGCAHHDY